MLEEGGGDLGTNKVGNSRKRYNSGLVLGRETHEKKRRKKVSRKKPNPEGEQPIRDRKGRPGPRVTTSYSPQRGEGRKGGKGGRAAATA